MKWLFCFFKRIFTKFTKRTVFFIFIKTEDFNYNKIIEFFEGGDLQDIENLMKKTNCSTLIELTHVITEVLGKRGHFIDLDENNEIYFADEEDIKRNLLIIDADPKPKEYKEFDWQYYYKRDNRNDGRQASKTKIADNLSAADLQIYQFSYN